MTASAPSWLEARRTNRWIVASPIILAGADHILDTAITVAAVRDATRDLAPGQRLWVLRSAHPGIPVEALQAALVWPLFVIECSRCGGQGTRDRAEGYSHCDQHAAAVSR